MILKLRKRCQKKRPEKLLVGNGSCKCRMLGELHFIPLTGYQKSMNARDHYDQHLGNFYSWMLGDFDEKQKEQENFFWRNGIKPASGKVAFDLGAGNGLQAISLAKLGFAVKAIDFNTQLLNELTSRKSNLNIETINYDILAYLQGSRHQAELVICMGDTITHLENIDQVTGKTEWFTCKKCGDRFKKLFTNPFDFFFNAVFFFPWASRAYECPRGKSQEAYPHSSNPKNVLASSK